MKKNLISAAFILLTMAVSAFTYHSKKAEEKSHLSSLYWYVVTYNSSYPNGVIMSASDIRFGGAPQTKTYADANDGCIGTAKHCLRGFSSTLSSFPNTSPQADVTTKN